jgi:hypothetical protein
VSGDRDGSHVLDIITAAISAVETMLATANPHRAGACSECGAWRTDGRPPYLHEESCSRHGDLQLERWLAEQQAGDHGGPVLYCTEPGHDHGGLSS